MDRKSNKFKVGTKTKSDTLLVAWFARARSICFSISSCLLECTQFDFNKNRDSVQFGLNVSLAGRKQDDD